MTPHPDASAPEPIDPLSPEVLDALGLPRPNARPTGPKTVAGKARSRANAVKHGLRCQVVEPPDQRAKIAERVAEWTHALQPNDTVQRWLVARAATASVRLDRCVERENLALEQNTARAERDWMRRRRAWARRTGARLEEPGGQAYARLTGSAFGCDWLIARFDELAPTCRSPAATGRVRSCSAPSACSGSIRRIPPGHPLVSQLFRASLAADKAPDPQEVERFLGLDTSALEPDARAAEQRRHLGNRERGRLALLAIVPPEQHRLRDLREALWTEIDAPALEQACARARTFDDSPEAELRPPLRVGPGAGSASPPPGLPPRPSRGGAARRGGAERTSRWEGLRPNS